LAFFRSRYLSASSMAVRYRSLQVPEVHFIVDELFSYCLMMKIRRKLNIGVRQCISIKDEGVELHYRAQREPVLKLLSRGCRECNVEQPARKIWDKQCCFLPLYLTTERMCTLVKLAFLQYRATNLYASSTDSSMHLSKLSP
jgi:hypothetical protein